MTKISNWALVASAAIGAMAMGCTVTTTDGLDGGGTGGTATGGSSGAGGTPGVDAGGTGGSAGTGVVADAAPDSSRPMGACETCIYASECRGKAEACRADTVNGCADAVDDFYDCLAGGTGDSVMDCGVNFSSEAQVHGGDAALSAADLANALAGCVMDLPCVTTCRTADGG